MSSLYHYDYQYKSISFSSREQYLRVLKALSKKARRMEIAIPCGDAPDDELIVSLRSFLLAKKLVGEWAGTLSGGRKTAVYSYAFAPKIYQKLSSYTAFFAYGEAWDKGPFSELGDKDFVFFDEKDNVLFWTTAHEGYADIAAEELKFNEFLTVGYSFRKKRPWYPIN